MRLGKIEKEVLIHLLGLKKPIHKRAILWKIGKARKQIYKDKHGFEWGVYEKCHSVVSRAFRKLFEKQLICWLEFSGLDGLKAQYKPVEVKSRYIALSNQGKLVARGIKISRAKIRTYKLKSAI